MKDLFTIKWFEWLVDLEQPSVNFQAFHSYYLNIYNVITFYLAFLITPKTFS